MTNLAGKTALVTGGSRGIGRAIVRELIARGARVAVGYRKEGAAARAVAKEDASGESFALALDVTKRAAVRKAARKAARRFGKLDILVNNAGINKPNDFDKITDADWNAVLATNLYGPFCVTQEFLPLMRRGGSIIMISSVSGQYGGPRTTHYAVSKAGLISLAENLAIFCAPKGIRVNAVAPGVIESPMAKAAQKLPIAERILLKRLGTVEEVAHAVVFLASDDASYVTAQTLNVNGGLYF